MKIAIIGSGFFGVACAIELSEQNNVHLYEKEADILQQASKKNQFRFHLGYHYPRSVRTVREIKKSNILFKNFYKKLNVEKTNNFYAIAKKESKTNLKKFIEFTRKNNLNLRRIANTQNFYRSDFYLSKETNLNYFHFKNYIKKILKKKKSNFF